MEELDWFENWMEDDFKIHIIDLVLEYLTDHKMLNVRGEEFAKAFYHKHIKEKHETQKSKT